MKKKNVHEGHRSRMRSEFKFSGFNNWHEHKVLEFILQRCIPRVDTNETAHLLIDAFGGFANVFKASEDQLKQIRGVGPGTAEYLHMLGEFIRYYNGVRFSANRYVLDSDSCMEYMLNLFDGLEREYFFMICLNARQEILCRELISEGNFNRMDIDTAQIARTAIKNDASYVVLAHNHPSGIASASDADIVATRAIDNILRPCGVELLDHIIVAGGKCVSMRAVSPWHARADKTRKNNA